MRMLRTAMAGVVCLAPVAGLGGMVVAHGEAMEPPSTASEPWDLVWFSDSTGFFVTELWAETIEEELGVEVRVHDYANGSLKVVEILESL
jgi:hypothetical protein